MVIDNLNVVGIPITPHKADAPLIVAANAVLSLSVTFERLQSIARRCSSRCATRETGDRLGTALAHRVFADAVCRHERPDLTRAERALLEAIRIEQEIGARPELARTYVSHARLLKARGERAQAQEVLARAIDMFRGMGMVWDLERAERELLASELPSSTE